METQTETYFVSRDSVALCFYHVVPSPRQTIRAVRRALRSEGYAPWTRTEAELLVRGGSALVVARRKTTKRQMKSTFLVRLQFGYKMLRIIDILLNTW